MIFADGIEHYGGNIERRPVRSSWRTYGDISGRLSAHIVGQAFNRIKPRSDPMQLSITIAQIANGFLVHAPTTERSDTISCEDYRATEATFFDDFDGVCAALPGIARRAKEAEEAAHLARVEEHKRWATEKARYSQTGAKQYVRQPAYEGSTEPAIEVGADLRSPSGPEAAFTIGAVNEPVDQPEGDRMDEADKRSI